MNPELQATTDHATIQQWAEQHQGRPAMVKRVEEVSHLNLLRFNFPDATGEQAREEITWEEFFAIFEQKKLAFLRAVNTSAAEESRFYKFVNRG